MTTPVDPNTDANETQNEAPFEFMVQRIFNWIIDRIPVGNNNDREWIKAHVDNLFVDENAPESNTVSGVGTSGALTGTAVPGVSAVPVETVPAAQTPPVPNVAPRGTSANTNADENATQVTTGTVPADSVPAETVDEVSTDPSAVGYPASYPAEGNAEDIRKWYATATDDEINQVNAARAASI